MSDKTKQTVEEADEVMRKAQEVLERELEGTGELDEPEEPEELEKLDTEADETPLEVEDALSSPDEEKPKRVRSKKVKSCDSEGKTFIRRNLDVVIAGALVFVLIAGFTWGYFFCGGYDAVVARGNIVAAAEKLAKIDGGYRIKTQIQSPSETTTTYEVRTKDGTYLQVPYDSSTTTEDAASKSSESSSLIVSDWQTPDGKLYQLNTEYEEDGGTTLWMEMPDSYSKLVRNRDSMYISLVKDEMTGVAYTGSATLTTETGSSFEVDVYTFDIPSSSVVDIVGMDTLGLYDSIRKDALNSGDSNVKELVGNEMISLQEALTFSQGHCTVGIDKDGVLRYFQLTAGGLGANMVYSKFAQEYTEDPIELPKFSESCSEYYSTIKSLADYLAENKDAIAEQTTSPAVQEGSEEATTQVVSASKSAETATSATKSK